MSINKLKMIFQAGLLSFWILSPSVQAHDSLHSNHGQHGAQSSVRRSVHSYNISDIDLVRQDARTLKLVDILKTNGPIYVNFIFTTCTTVCPVMSQTFSLVHENPVAVKSNAKFVSISIDPLQDTPPKLLAYGRKFNSSSRWQFFTGTEQSSVAAQQAFDVYRGDKMNHPVVTLYRRSPQSQWVRFEGFASPQMLLAELDRKD